MATFKTPTYDAQRDTRANTSRLAAPNNASGELAYLRVTYTVSAADAVPREANNDLIMLGVLPAGSIPVPELSSVTCSADPTTAALFTVDIGTKQDPDGWADGVDLAAGGHRSCMSPATLPAWAHTITPLSADDGTVGNNAEVYATIALTAATTLNAGTRLVFTLAYVKSRG